MKKFIFSAAFAIFLFPLGVLAGCSPNGYTVVYVNGILTTEQQAKGDLSALKNIAERGLKAEGVRFLNGYNPSHAAGLGDLAESAAQLFHSSINDYDLNTILSQLYSEITTRKMLLVGHSQGTFYTNELYDYLLAHGEPKSALGIYNIATPASFVSGSGAYLTSESDKVINAVRAAASKLGAPQPLPANISIPLTAQEAADPYGGHLLSRVYLAGAAAPIVSNIDDGLKKLSADSTYSTDSEQAGCFIPPPRSIVYYGEEGFFFVADPVAGGIVAGTASAVSAGELIYNAAAGALESAYAAVTKWLAFSNTRPGLAIVSDSFGDSASQDTEAASDAAAAAPSDRKNGSGNFSGSAANPAIAAKNNSLGAQSAASSSGSNDRGDSARGSGGQAGQSGASGGAAGGGSSGGGSSGISQTPQSSDGQAGDSERANDTASSLSSTNSDAEQGCISASSTASSTDSTPQSNSGQASSPQASSTSSATSSSTSSGTASSTDSTNSPQASSGQASSTSPFSTSSSLSDASHALIGEILFNASGTDVGKEFIELYNPADAAADLAGWSLKYRTDNATSGVSLASFKSASHQDDTAVIPAKGFLLVGLNGYDPENYGGRTADVSRSASLPNGESGGMPETITLVLSNASGSEIDRAAYDENSIASEGQSIERNALMNSACASAQNAGEFLGNGCDTDVASDFEMRNAPNPQNSESMPEPRTAPTVNDFRATYDFAPRFDFSWDQSEDAAGATSTLSYFIYDISAPTSTLIFGATSTISTSATYSIGEVGRNYDFEFRVEDRDGMPGIVTSTVAAKTFLDAFSFYPDTRAGHNGYAFDITTTSSRPFWDANNSSTDLSWNAIVFYLGKDAPKQSELITDNDLAVSDGSNVHINYDGCAGGDGNPSELIFPLDSASCIPGPLSAGAYNFAKLEDARFTIPLSSSTSDVSFSPTDFVTLAFYDFGGGGGGSQRLRLAAVDKTKYHFQTVPAAQFSPPTPGDFSAAFNAVSGVLNLKWSSSTDADTRDAFITYELNVSTSSALADSAWDPVGTSVFSTSIIPQYPNSYKLGIRAKDDWGNVSAPAMLEWSFPDGYAPYILSGDNNSAAQNFSLNQGGALNSIEIFTAGFQTDSRNPSTNVCSLDLFEIVGGSPQLAASNDTPQSGDGESGPYAYRGGGCAGDLTFTYAAAPELLTGHSYQWRFSFSSEAHGSVKFYGAANNAANGLFSDHAIANARFIIRAAGENQLFGN